MKRNKKHNIFGWLAASALLLTTACADNADLGIGQSGTDGTNIVTLNIQTQSLAGGTRAESGIETGNINIGKGSKVDILIFAVYEKKSDGNGGYTYTLLENYSKNTSLTIDENTINCGPGQSIIEFSKEKRDEGVTIQLATDPDKTYAVAFWAQSSQCDAYDTKDLTKVEVKYESATNNDELRDAFCVVDTIHGKSAQTKTIILKRPLAQINVGTTGADYNNLLSGANVFPNIGITTSKIELQGVAKYLNVVENKVITTEENGESALTTATFSFATIPAFMGRTVSTSAADLLGSNSLTDNKEEFLFVDLNGNGKITGKDDENSTGNGYLTAYPTIENSTFKTETFKYLSMCYVLVPENTTHEGQGNSYSSVLPQVEVSFGGNYMDATQKTATGATVDYKAITLKNVPVRRNWRTNILGGLYGKDVPTDEDPFDPSSVFNLTKAVIAVDPLYINDYDDSYVEKGNEDHWVDAIPSTPTAPPTE